MPSQVSLSVLVHFEEHWFLMISVGFLMFSWGECFALSLPLQEGVPQVSEIRVSSNRAGRDSFLLSFLLSNRIQMKHSRFRLWCEAFSSRAQVSEIEASSRKYAQTFGNPDFKGQVVSKWRILNNNPNYFRHRFQLYPPQVLNPSANGGPPSYLCHHLGNH